MAGRAQFWPVRIFQLQQLAETIKTGPPDIVVKGQEPASARYVLAVILFPSQSFPCGLQYQCELVEKVNISIERKETVQHLPEEIHRPRQQNYPYSA